MEGEVPPSERNLTITEFKLFLPKLEAIGSLQVGIPLFFNAFLKCTYFSALFFICGIIIFSTEA